MDGALPIVDVSPFVRDLGMDARAACAASARSALERSGFLVVSGHGVPETIVAAAHSAYRAFYAMPAEWKLGCAGSFMTTDADGRLRHAPRGYSPGAGDEFAREAFAVQKEDWDPADEYFNSAAAAPWVALEPAQQNLWPDESATASLEGFRAAITEYYSEMERLAVVLEEMMAEALGLPSAYFVERANRSISNMVGFSFGLGKEGVVVPAHDDEGDFTILSHDPELSGSTGLELQLPEDNPWMVAESATQRAQDRIWRLHERNVRGDVDDARNDPKPAEADGVWRAVERVPGCFIISEYCSSVSPLSHFKIRLVRRHRQPDAPLLRRPVPIDDAPCPGYRSPGSGWTTPVHRVLPHAQC
jgi:isopenicillin N synthase-like dioxygenase